MQEPVAVVTFAKKDDNPFVFNVPQEEIKPGLRLTLETGHYLELKSLEPEPVWEMGIHPVVEDAGMSLREAEKQVSYGVVCMVRAIVLLADAHPLMEMANLLKMLEQRMPWTLDIVESRMRLGLSFDDLMESMGRVSFSINMPNYSPNITMPEQPAPVVYVDVEPELKATLELPPVETETINITRDSSGFISEATKTRRRGKVAST